ncbi:MAG: hypothetical protein Q4F72_03220, partial [Desulfovibrionaceae bacterium]|nr:hypothetical protein [Desulfovibrionaceae bacterium]
AGDRARAAAAPRPRCETPPGHSGFDRWGAGGADGPLTLGIRRSWDRDRVLRYDAQVTDSAGQCLVAVNHIEYNALPESGSSL